MNWLLRVNIIIKIFNFKTNFKQFTVLERRFFFFENPTNLIDEVQT